jgi:hypothetical protein
MTTRQLPCTEANMANGEYTGGKTSYYEVTITLPTKEGRTPYVAECNDIIEALNMTFAEGEAFKAVWRRAAARLGQRKAGYDGGKYDADKVAFFGQRMAVQARQGSHEEKETGVLLEALDAFREQLVYNDTPEGLLEEFAALESFIKEAVQ